MNTLLAKLKESDRRLAAMYESQLASTVPGLVAEAKASAAPVKVAVRNVGISARSMLCARPCWTSAVSSARMLPLWWRWPA